MRRETAAPKMEGEMNPFNDITEITGQRKKIPRKLEDRISAEPVGQEWFDKREKEPETLPEEETKEIVAMPEVSKDVVLERTSGRRDAIAERAKKSIVPGGKRPMKELAKKELEEDVRRRETALRQAAERVIGRRPRTIEVKKEKDAVARSAELEATFPLVAGVFQKLTNGYRTAEYPEEILRLFLHRKEELKSRVTSRGERMRTMEANRPKGVLGWLGTLFKNPELEGLKKIQNADVDLLAEAVREGKKVGIAG